MRGLAHAGAPCKAGIDLTPPTQALISETKASMLSGGSV